MVVSRSSGNTGSERKKDLLCRIKYCNRLPDIPFDPKFLVYPFDANRFVKYHHTSLEGDFKHELHTEADLGLDVDLISMDFDRENETSNFNEIDEKLLEDEVVPSSSDTSKSQRRGIQVSWLRRTEYISSEYRQFQNKGLSTENKIGVSVKKKLQGKDLYKDRESQIDAIEQTFEAVTQTIPNRKNGVYPVEVSHVFPDFDNWRYPFAQVIFDTKPIPVGCDQKDIDNLEKKMDKAMIRGMVDDQGHQFVVYFLPTNETLDKLDKRGESAVEMEQLEYKLAREYNWTVNNDESSKGYEEKFFLVWRDGNVYYNELGTRVKLTKRRYKGKKRNQIKLVVRPRELLDGEIANWEARMKALEKAELEEPVEEAPEQQKEGEKTDEEGEEDDDFGSPKIQSPNVETETAKKQPEEAKTSSEEEEEEEEDEAKNIFGSDDDDDDDDISLLR